MNVSEEAHLSAIGAEIGHSGMDNWGRISLTFSRNLRKQNNNYAMSQ